MFNFLRFILCAVSIGISGYAQAAQEWQVLPEKSKVEFTLYSTIHEVNGTAQEFLGGFEQKTSFIKGFVDVGVKGLITGNKNRDNNMYQMFDSARYPQIHFVFDNTDVTNVLEHKYGDVAFIGIMTIHNISHPMTLLSKAKMVGDNFVCEGNMVIHLKDYDLKPPSVLGLIRVKDEVNVRYTITFVNKESAQ